MGNIRYTVFSQRTFKGAKETRCPYIFKMWEKSQSILLANAKTLVINKLNAAGPPNRLQWFKVKSLQIKQETTNFLLALNWT